MCEKCATQYRDAGDQQFCTATPFRPIAVLEVFAGGQKVDAVHLGPTDGPVCGGPLKKVDCLLCMDTNEVKTSDGKGGEVVGPCPRKHGAKPETPFDA